MQNTFSINDIVWAKVKGCIELTIIKTYLDPWWPARIARIVRTKENDQKYLVNFIGHNSHATIQLPLIVPYAEKHEEIVQKAKNKQLLEAISIADQLLSSMKGQQARKIAKLNTCEEQIVIQPSTDELIDQIYQQIINHQDFRPMLQIVVEKLKSNTINVLDILHKQNGKVLNAALQLLEKDQQIGNKELLEDLKQIINQLQQDLIVAYFDTQPIFKSIQKLPHIANVDLRKKVCYQLKSQFDHYTKETAQNLALIIEKKVRTLDPTMQKTYKETIKLVLHNIQNLDSCQQLKWLENNAIDEQSWGKYYLLMNLFIEQLTSMKKEQSYTSCSNSKPIDMLNQEIDEFGG